MKENTVEKLLHAKNEEEEIEPLVREWLDEICETEERKSQSEVESSDGYGTRLQTGTYEVYFYQGKEIGIKENFIDFLTEAIEGKKVSAMMGWRQRRSTKIEVLVFLLKELKEAARNYSYDIVDRGMKNLFIMLRPITPDEEEEFLEFLERKE